MISLAEFEPSDREYHLGQRGELRFVRRSLSQRRGDERAGGGGDGFRAGSGEYGADSAKFDGTIQANGP